MADRVISARILGDSRDDRCLCKIQVFDIFVKVLLRCRLDTIGTAAEIDRVEIILKNTLLGSFFAPQIFDELLLKLYSQELFLEFSFDPVEQGDLLRPCRENVVLQQLLGYCARSLRKFKAIFDSDYRSTDNTFGIDPAMLIKALVLDGNDRILKVNGNIIDRHRDPVRIRGRELLQLNFISVVICRVNESRIAARRDIDVRDIRCVRDDPSCDAQSAENTYDKDRDKYNEEQPEQHDSDAPLESQ